MFMYDSLALFCDKNIENFNDCIKIYDEDFSVGNFQLCIIHVAIVKKKRMLF